MQSLSPLFHWESSKSCRVLWILYTGSIEVEDCSNNNPQESGNDGSGGPKFINKTCRGVPFGHWLLVLAYQLPIAIFSICVTHHCLSNNLNSSETLTLYWLYSPFDIRKGGNSLSNFSFTTCKTNFYWIYGQNLSFICSISSAAWNFHMLLFSSRTTALILKKSWHNTTLSEGLSRVQNFK